MSTQELAHKSSRRDFLKRAGILAGLGLAAIGGAGASSAETSASGSNDLAAEVQKYLKDIDPKEFGPAIAKFLFDQGIALAKAAEVLRKNGTNIASSALPDATFYIAPSQGPNGDVLSMGFRSDTKADWVTAYAAKGPKGPWFQLIQNKLERDVNGNPTGGISIVLLRQYGTRGDGFDSNYTGKP